MSIKLNLDEKDNNNNSNNNRNLSKEHKWKELLYELFYEIKSETLGCKIEIEEDEYQENIRTITYQKLIKYVHDSIRILLKKKIDDAKLEQKEEDEKYYRDLNYNSNNNILSQEEKKQYENLIHKLESKERNITKLYFQVKLQKDAMENKISEYMEMEEEFEEMKTKLKYEEGRFLNNDRKDNEIIIIRGENSNLKQSIRKLENQIKNMENNKQKNHQLINNLQNEIKQLKLKIEELKKQIDILNAHSINININNVHGEENKNGILNNINNGITKEDIILGKHKNINNKNKMFHFQKINNKFIKNNNQNNPDFLSNTRNESLERTQSDLLNKYLIRNKINKNNVYLNNSSIKNNQLQYASSSNQILSVNNRNNSHIPIFTKQVNMKNFNIIKKIVYSGDSYSNRSNSTKIKGNANKIIDFKSLS